MLRIIDLFAGAGGFGLGFKISNCDVFCSLEIDHWAAETLKENNKGNQRLLKTILEL
jgi:DNA (cytosine-5)-methyltransferase 1